MALATIREHVPEAFMTWRKVKKAYDGSELELNKIPGSPSTLFLAPHQQFKNHLYITLPLPVTRCAYIPLPPSHEQRGAYLSKNFSHHSTKSIGPFLVWNVTNLELCARLVITGHQGSMSSVACTCKSCKKTCPGRGSISVAFR